jgi:type 1 glutamine amidotransferase
MTGPAVPDRYREQAPAEAASPSPRAREAFETHLAGGGGVLGMHTAALCFDDWPGWGGTLGAAWVWGDSFHPPLGPEVTASPMGPHPLVAGLDTFSLVDEVYSGLDRQPDVEGLLHATPPGVDSPPQPLLWARDSLGGRVVYDALGHHPPSYEVPEHREIVRRAIAWTTRG